MKAHQLKPLIVDLPTTETVRLRFEGLSCEELDLVPDTSREMVSINADVAIVRKTDVLSVDFEVAFELHANCFRCLAPFTARLRSRHHLDYVSGPDPRLSAGRTRLTPQDIDRVYDANVSLDLAIGIREAMILALPPVLLCAPDCAGLCPMCGKPRASNACSCTPQRVERFSLPQE